VRMVRGLGDQRSDDAAMPAATRPQSVRAAGERDAQPGGARRPPAHASGGDARGATGHDWMRRRGRRELVHGPETVTHASRALMECSSSLAADRPTRAQHRGGAAPRGGGTPRVSGLRPSLGELRFYAGLDGRSVEVRGPFPRGRRDRAMRARRRRGRGTGGVLWAHVLCNRPARRTQSVLHMQH